MIYGQGRHKLRQHCYDWVKVHLWQSHIYNTFEAILVRFLLSLPVSVLLYGCTTKTLTKQLEKKLDEKYTRMLHDVLDKFSKQLSIKQLLYSHLPSITQTI